MDSALWGWDVSYAMELSDEEAKRASRAIDRERVTADDFSQASDTFALLASPVRVRLLWLLSEDACDVGHLADRLGVSVATASHHLGRMRLAGLVSARSEGRRQVYSLDDPHVVSLVIEAVDHHADLRARRR
jgi:DNA-binding transcriptional ArsR family regulator